MLSMVLVCPTCGTTAAPQGMYSGSSHSSTATLAMVQTQGTCGSSMSVVPPVQPATTSLSNTLATNLLEAVNPRAHALAAVDSRAAGAAKMCGPSSMALQDGWATWQRPPLPFQALLRYRVT